MAKSKFSPKGVKASDNVFLQNEKAMKKIKPAGEKFADSPVIPTKPHDLFDEKAQFSSSKEEKQELVETKTIPTKVSDVEPSNILSAYPLSSGSISNAEILLLTDPLKESVNWEDNPRTDEERQDTSDIDESIIASGMNVVPAIARRKNGVIEIIEGSRRRESCIRNHKPLLTLVVDDMSDDDAKTITVFGNEGRKDPNVFSRVDGYRLLLEGERPLCRSKADLARRLGMKREWVSQLMGVSELPKPIKQCLSVADLDELTAKQAIKLSKGFFSLSEERQQEVVKWASVQEDAGSSELFNQVFGSLTPPAKDKAKLGTMNIVSRMDRISVVKNKSTAGLFIQIPDGVNVDELGDEQIKTLLKEVTDNMR